MADYFVGQTNIQIRLETGQDCISSTCLIKYKKPNKKTGSFSATIDTNDADNSIIYYNVDSARDLDIPGKWYFWSHVTFVDGSIGIGKVTSQQIKAEGDG